MLQNILGIVFFLVLLRFPSLWLLLIGVRFSFLWADSVMLIHISKRTEVLLVIVYFIWMLDWMSLIYTAPLNISLCSIICCLTNTRWILLIELRLCQFRLIITRILWSTLFKRVIWLIIFSLFISSFLFLVLTGTLNIRLLLNLRASPGALSRFVLSTGLTHLVIARGRSLAKLFFLSTA